MLAAAVQETGRAWRRALLVPLRLFMLLVGLIAVLSALAWNLVATRELLQKQLEATQFLDLPGWRLTLRPDTAPTRGRSARLTDDPVIQSLEAGYPALSLMTGLAAVRSPNQAGAQYHGLAFATPETGLSALDFGGDTPCVWLGARVPQGDEWVVERRLRCRAMPIPRSWQSLVAEMEQPTLVLPVAAAPLAKGAQWRQSVSMVLTAGSSPCSSARAVVSLRCDSLAANRSAGADAGRALGRWNAWVLPAALLAALLAVLIYLQGLKPVLQIEFALRTALGMPEARAARWLAGAALAQLAWVLLGLAVPVLGLSLAMQTALPQNDALLCAAWVAACGALGVPFIVGQAWRNRHQSLQKLGRLD